MFPLSDHPPLNSSYCDKVKKLLNKHKIAYKALELDNMCT